MDAEKRLAILEKEVAELKRGLEARPKIQISDEALTIAGERMHIVGDMIVDQINVKADSVTMPAIKLP